MARPVCICPACGQPVAQSVFQAVPRAAVSEADLGRRDAPRCYLPLLRKGLPYTLDGLTVQPGSPRYRACQNEAERLARLSREAGPQGCLPDE